MLEQLVKVRLLGLSHMHEQGSYISMCKFKRDVGLFNCLKFSGNYLYYLL